MSTGMAWTSATSDPVGNRVGRNMSIPGGISLTPQWVKGSIFYQIFPDRFRRSQRSERAPAFQFEEWGTKPSFYGYQGGDLRGIVEKLDYLQDLNVTALYLNPIFTSASPHRYHPYDYFSIDPLLGGMDAFTALRDALQARGMRLILDGVFNHVSRGFWAFHHVLENGRSSPYVDWFYIHDWPLHPYSGAAGQQNYAAWWDLPALPKLRVENPDVQAYLWQVVEFWTEKGIDGWRLDVPEEIQVPGFWEEFRRRVKRINPEAYVVGEVWDSGKGWLDGDRFDGITNYSLGRHALGFFARDALPAAPMDLNGHTVRRLDAAEFADQVDRMIRGHGWEFTQCNLNYLDSHDMPRMLHLAGGDTSALKLMQGFQMTMAGVPLIYYGTEIGMDGAGDPDCRRAFPWHNESLWHQDVLAHVKWLTKLRRDNRVLQEGRHTSLQAQEDIYVFKRFLDPELAYVAFNAGHAPVQVHIKDPYGPQQALILRDGATGSTIHCINGSSDPFMLEGRSLRVLLRQLD